MRVRVADEDREGILRTVAQASKTVRSPQGCVDLQKGGWTRWIILDVFHGTGSGGQEL